MFMFQQIELLLKIKKLINCKFTCIVIVIFSDSAVDWDVGWC